MKVKETGLQGLLIVEPSVFTDDRGYFFESFQEPRYNSNGIAAKFIQDNESKSVRGVVRGLHYQIGSFAQAKLVRVVSGKVFDVAVDLRSGSPTYGKWFGIELDDQNRLQLFIPRGFAHGFSVLSETAVFTYKCDNVYNRDAERSINPFDEQLSIDWMVERSHAIVSEKDLLAPAFARAETNFSY